MAFMIARHRMIEGQMPPTDRTYARLSHGLVIDWERKRDDATKMSQVEAFTLALVLDLHNENKREWVKITGFWYEFGVIEFDSNKGG